MSDEHLRELARAATEAPDDLGASVRLENAQARAGIPLGSPVRAPALAAFACSLAAVLARHEAKTVGCQWVIGCIGARSYSVGATIDHVVSAAQDRLPHGIPFEESASLVQGDGTRIERSSFCLAACEACTVDMRRYAYPDPPRGAPRKVWGGYMTEIRITFATNRHARWSPP